MTPLLAGQRVRFSTLGRERVRSMPEAWGLHRALYEDQLGEVVETEPDAPGGPRVSVEFPDGGAHGWEMACFEHVAGTDAV